MSLSFGFDSGDGYQFFKLLIFLIQERGEFFAILYIDRDALFFTVSLIGFAAYRLVKRITEKGSKGGTH